MELEERNEAYNQYVNSKMPKTKWFPSLFNAFWVGGLICIIGQVIYDTLMTVFPALDKYQATSWMLVALIFLAALFTGIGIYDRIGSFAGAGTILPITGFSNSIVSPAMEFRREGIIFGLCAKMFVIAGPVIVGGVVGSVIVGFISLFF